MSAASPGSASELLESTAELPQDAASAPSAPATPALVASSNNAQPLILPAATASASPSPNEAVSASAFGLLQVGNDDLKRNIADLQQSNTLLHRENQAMRAKIADIQGAFAGIVGFLEAAIVRPATAHHAHGAETMSPVVEAFKKLASDISPALSHPCPSEHQERSTDFLQPAPFRAERRRQDTAARAQPPYRLFDLAAVLNPAPSPTSPASPRHPKNYQQRQLP
ncbi:hypothetical protein LPJ72_005841 [Coemansia sp. Benny D160-2]|nr:hypothetical protein LPJ72_005841 [Coemansia sp. Benny D160-2]